MASLGPPARAASRPDLTVASVTSPPPTATAGDSLELTYVLRNAGPAAAGASTTGFWLSRDARKGSGDVKIGTDRVGRLRARKSVDGSVTLTLPRSTRATDYYVIACADFARKVRESKETNNCRRSAGKVSVSAAGSSELIDGDLASGKISEEQALIYNVFANFSDPRLPDKYEAAPTGLEDGVLDDVAAAWDSLSPEAQTTLGPFLVPPFYAGSHWSPELPSGTKASAFQAPPQTGGSPWCSGSTDIQPLFNTWSHIDSADGKFRIWWLASNTSDATTAADLMSDLENKIAPALISLMGRGPLADGDGYCDGGSTALDIALVDAATASVITDKSNCSSTTSTHMVFPRTAASAGWAGLSPYLAHEVMHTIQYAFPLSGSCTSYKWLREATAEWVQDYVTDPSYGIGIAPDDTEFQAARIYMRSPETSLDVVSPPPHHDYGAYLLPFYAVRRSSPGFIKDVWTNAGSNAALDAVDKALPGGFEETWADFALTNWNAGPVRDYKDWDGLTASPSLTAEATVPVDEGFDVNTNIPYLAARYYRFDFAGGVKTITFGNPFVGQDHVSVRAVITLADGSQRIEDWSDKEEIKFCRDLENENIREVTVIVANKSKDPADEITDKFFVFGEKEGCVCKPSGTMARAAQAGSSCPGLSGTYTWTHNSSFTSSTGHGDSNGSLTLNLNLPPIPDDPETSYVEGQYNWEGKDGATVSYESTSYGFGDDGFCTLETEETYTGGEVTDARADTDEEMKILWVDVTYTWEWTKTITYGGDCAHLGTATGTDSGTSTIFIMAEGNGDGTWTYHAEYHNPTQGGGSSSTVENGTFSRG